MNLGSIATKILSSSTIKTLAGAVKDVCTNPKTTTIIENGIAEGIGNGIQAIYNRAAIKIKNKIAQKTPKVTAELGETAKNKLSDIKEVIGQRVKVLYDENRNPIGEIRMILENDKIKNAIQKPLAKTKYDGVTKDVVNYFIEKGIKKDIRDLIETILKIPPKEISKVV